ncbi:butyrophilin subfamily 2 member A2-like [Acipenser oxyrinchus oxyrinchus]|uniref:Butyrophilin subfamily 2 member A2-like n=1 Tax=Acipenser oxyrinchus oxyrinchus TaxID=40147 RepID=A0AAD8CFV9_ACIOX|nr:butyrophilin subfamily 2 member A2-like [Acipenser oxyrinchus oxyrinchus]
MLSRISIFSAFNLIVPTSPVISTAGEDSVLPCRVSTEIKTEDFEVRWYRERFNNPIYEYKNGKEVPENQNREYQGRTSLLDQQLGGGVLSLVLTEVRVSDEGKYTCYAGTSKWYEEPNMELQVQALGSDPVIHIEEHLKRSITLSCVSLGWYPQPEMYWTDGAGRNVTALTQPSIQRDGNGLYSIRSHLPVKNNNDAGVICLVIQKRQRREMKSRLQISEQFFESTNPERLYISVFLSSAAIVLVCIMTACLYVFKRKRGENKQGLFVRTQLSKTQVFKKKLHSLSKLLLWKWIQEAAVNVILDPDTANKRLILSVDGTSMTLGEENRDPPDTGRRFEHPLCVLGREGFTSKHYWEVEVGKKTGWIVGAATESAKRNGQVILFPELGFWVLRLENEKFYANAVIASPTILPMSLKPQKLGVYLDYEERQLSFYNVETRSHIYTFTDMELNTKEKVYPLAGTTPSCKGALDIHHFTHLKTETSTWAALSGEEDTMDRYSKEDHPLLPDKKRLPGQDSKKKFGFWSGLRSEKKEKKKKEENEKREEEIEKAKKEKEKEENEKREEEIEKAKKEKKEKEENEKREEEIEKAKKENEKKEENEKREEEIEKAKKENEEKEENEKREEEIEKAKKENEEKEKGKEENKEKESVPDEEKELPEEESEKRGDVKKDKKKAKRERGDKKKDKQNQKQTTP